MMKWICHCQKKHAEKSKVFLTSLIKIKRCQEVGENSKVAEDVGFMFLFLSRLHIRVWSWILHVTTLLAKQTTASCWLHGMNIYEYDTHEVLWPLFWREARKAPSKELERLFFKSEGDAVWCSEVPWLQVKQTTLAEKKQTSKIYKSISCR